MSIENCLVLQASKGLRFHNNPPHEEKCDFFKKNEIIIAKVMKFSRDGSLLAWSTNQRVTIVSTKDNKIIVELTTPFVAELDFSPKGLFLSTWTQYRAKSTPEASCNLHIWDINNGNCIKSFIQKKHSTWNLQWSEDEFICSRNVNNEVHFFENLKFDTIAKKIYLQKIADFSLAPGLSPYHLTCFVPGQKGQPSFVRLFQYPKFEGSNSIISQKSFFKAESVQFYWNATGKDCIFKTSVEVDKSGTSYYGELNLYFISIKGDTAKVILGKEGPVYSIEWNPNSLEFCVVYGFMPAKATIYNLKCEAIFDFGVGPRNEVKYSPLGNRLSLSGFGNLQGNIEIWDTIEKKQITKFTATDSTYLEWSPDGEFILTASTSPRLRIGNGYRIWHYTGSLLQEIFLDINEELYNINWKPFPKGTFHVKQSLYIPVPGIKSIIPEASKQVYRPPSARGKPSSFKLHDDETSNQQESSSNKILSKNQKKNLARKAKKELEKLDEDKKIEKSSNENQISDHLSPINDNSMDPEKNKKIKSLLKKLEQIEKLKNDLKSGKQLELNQLEKIKKQQELEEELKKLQM